MGARGRGRSLDDLTVKSDPLERAVTPEAPRPPQVVRGTWDCWDTVHSTGTPTRVLAGDLDDRVAELHDLAKAHGSDELIRACRARLGVMESPAPEPVVHPEPKPFAGFSKAKSD
jgi:hypothetical protein